MEHDFEDKSLRDSFIGSGMNSELMVINQTLWDIRKGSPVIIGSYSHAGEGELYELLVILSIVEADGTVLQKDICQRFAIPKQTVNAIIKTLTDKGWLELKVSEQDRRSRKLSLTPEGSAQAAQIAQALQEHEAQVWLRLGLDRAEQLIEHTALYNRHFREVSG